MSAADAAGHDGRQRMTLSEQNRMLYALLTRQQRDRSSVTITRNARGAVQIEVLVRTGESDVETIEDAELLARKVYDRLAIAYPHTEGGPS